MAELSLGPLLVVDCRSAAGLPANGGDRGLRDLPAAGDSLAKEILEETAKFIAIWLGTIIDLLEPDVMIIGGGAATLIYPFFDEICNLLPAWTVNPRVREIPLLRAHYGNEAGIAGGAALCLDFKRRRRETADSLRHVAVYSR